MKIVFRTKCYDCGREILILTEHDRCIDGIYSCNRCVPENSKARNGIDEAVESEFIGFLKGGPQ